MKVSDTWISPREQLIGNRRSARRRRFFLCTAVLLLSMALGLWPVVRPPVLPSVPPLVVNDVSQLNPILVGAIMTPTTTEEIIDAIRRHPGPIAIGGARHSMGGQIAAAGGLHIDMRRFNRILRFSPEQRTITVQAGTTWRQIQEHIDGSNLSVLIMQSYANFTVGGSLSVNGHGRYVGLGSLIRSVRSIAVILADGELVRATPTEHADIFNGVIGGYGGLGVIVEATLDLTDNVRLKRYSEILPVSSYRQFFVDRIRGRAEPVFHSANIFAEAYSHVRVVTFEKTTEPVTVVDRLRPVDQGYRVNRLAFWMVSEWPMGKALQRWVIDPIYFAGAPVTWRNYEASYDVAELEPSSRASATYVLQEYFVPVRRFDDFVPRLRDVLRRHRVNVVNVSIRHALDDPWSLLAWAPTEVFAFVIYYKQGTDEASRQAVGVWTRELTDAALDLGGSYYLPYQLHATADQFRRAYPRADEYFALKQRVDPTNKFRNAMLDRYYRPASAGTGSLTR